MYAILGSGFGLYGYLPALALNGERVVLPQRYRLRFQSRPELGRFASAVLWASDETEALDSAQGAVLALRPEDQGKWIAACIGRPHIKRLLLEKPLAPTPESATALLQDLVRARKAFRIGYMFRYTAWGRELARLIAIHTGGSISVRWSFMAHHFQHDLRNWKRSAAQGGGALRFYGIQVIAMLAEFGCRDVEYSECIGVDPDEIEKWTAAFAGPDLSRCDVAIDSRSLTSRFEVRFRTSDSRDQFCFESSDPFDPGTSVGDNDRRVPILSELYRSFSEHSEKWCRRYGEVNLLWQQVEEKTRCAASG